MSIVFTVLMFVAILAIVYVALDAFVIVPGAHYGVLLRFGNRTGRILEEGLGLKIPLIDKVELFSIELDKIDVKVTFTTVDKLQLTAKGSLQYRPDPRIADEQDRNVFFAMSEEIIKSGIEDALQALLGGLGGVYKAESFIKNRQALGDLINAILRLQTPPHLRHNPTTCGVAGCAMPELINAEDLVKFYNDHWRSFRDEMEIERQHIDDHSEAELRYGIDIETFALATIDFSEATKVAFEREQQAKARERAFKAKLRMAQKAKDLGANAQVALNAADVSLDPEIKKRVVSVEGEAGILGGVFGGLKGE